jgi:hypothetical protein
MLALHTAIKLHSELPDLTTHSHAQDPLLSNQEDFASV